MKFTFAPELPSVALLAFLGNRRVISVQISRRKSWARSLANSEDHHHELLLPQVPESVNNYGRTAAPWPQRGQKRVRRLVTSIVRVLPGDLYGLLSLPACVLGYLSLVLGCYPGAKGSEVSYLVLTSNERLAKLYEYFQMTTKSHG